MGERQTERVERKATCHPDRKHRALGLCYSCYTMAWRIKKGLDPLGGLRAFADKRRQEDPGYGRRYGLQKNHGLSLEDYQRLWMAQSGCCAICRTPLDILDVDHDHHTGTIRGLLCTWCNLGIGLFHDNVVRLGAAITYLAHPPMLQIVQGSGGGA